MSSTASPDLRLTALLWTAGPLLAWAVFPYLGFVSQPQLDLHTWADVFRVLGLVTLNALPLGLIAAALQVVALPPAWGDRRAWFFGTLLGHVIGLPGGFALAVTIMWSFSRQWAPDLLVPGSG